MATDIGITHILVILIFIIVLIILVSEKIDKTALALIGATAVAVVIFLFPQHDLHNPDEIIEIKSLLKLLPWDTVMFIFFMMMIVTMSARSGLFQWLAVVSIQITKGHPQTLYFAFVLLTFVMSFFFDTVTTMLILAPLTIEIMKVLNRDFRPYLIAEAIVANFASIPSLIGSVPNIVIGNKAQINFLQFLIILGPLTLILLITSIPVFLYFHNGILKQQQAVSDIDMRIFLLDATVVIKQEKTFLISILGIVILVLGFTIGQAFSLGPILTAMIAMTFLIIETRESIGETLKEVQWGTIFFIVGLLIIVQAIEELGIIELAAELLEPIIAGIPSFSGVLMINIAGVLSGIVDNIPISAALAPVATTLGDALPTINGKYLALGLIVGVNVGGYLTPIASPANILALSYSEKEHTPISFVEFAKLGTTLSIIHLVISSIYFYLFDGIITNLIEIL
jgi:Na+/H+ antiporter NhaD/arsenite permease-like protein